MHCHESKPIWWLVTVVHSRSCYTLVLLQTVPRNVMQCNLMQLMYITFDYLGIAYKDSNYTIVIAIKESPILVLKLTLVV